MRDIADLEHFVLQPGELLILRPRIHISQDRLQRMMETIKPLGRQVLVLPPDTDVMAGELVLMGAEPPPEPAQEDIEAARDEMMRAYTMGKTLWAWEHEDDGWFFIHRTMNPHVFQWNRFKYSLKAPKP